LLRFDEPGIEKYSFRLFTYNDRVGKKRTEDGIDYHRLFASMLTGRSWKVISGSSGENLATARSDNEMDHIQNSVSSGKFILAITEILAALPREMLLLLKTNDLIRAVDESVGVTKSGDSHMLRLLSVMGWYCAQAVRNETSKQLSESSTFVLFKSRYWQSVYDYFAFSLRMILIDAYVKYSELLA
jgi:aarF domain-containing kinase